MQPGSVVCVLSGPVVLLAGVLGGCSFGAGGALATRRASFADFDRRARAGKAMNVVFFGGSLTWGANASDPQRTSYRALMGQYLRRRYPRAPLTFHDAAIGGTGSKLGLFRLDRDVLARKPDLVFLDFTANDDLSGTDVQTLATYECLLREMISQGIPVVQVLLGFQWNFQPQFDPKALPRRRDHLRLASAYGTGVADTFPYLQQRLEEKTVTIKELWPIDGVHPGDAGYERFYETVRDGYDQAVRERRTCTAPDEPVFAPAYRTRRRIRLVAGPLPAGWRREQTFRTSMWFDGLSSRWMDDLAVCDAKDAAHIQPIRHEFTGTFVGVFAEADENGLAFEARVDGQLVPYQPSPKKPAQDVWPANTKRFGKGRLFIWRVISTTLPPGRHTLEIRPVVPAGTTQGQLRIESICTAAP